MLVNLIALQTSILTGHNARFQRMRNNNSLMSFGSSKNLECQNAALDLYIKIANVREEALSKRLKKEIERSFSTFG